MRMISSTRSFTLRPRSRDNLDEPAHRLMREVAAEGPWAGRLADAAGRLAPNTAEWYYDARRGRAARYLANHLPACPGWRGECGRGVVKGSRAAPVPRCSGRTSARIFSPDTRLRSGTPTGFIPTAPSCCRFRGCSSSPRGEGPADLRRATSVFFLTRQWITVGSTPSFHPRAENC